jgi:hypothetical protein
MVLAALVWIGVRDSGMPAETALSWTPMVVAVIAGGLLIGLLVPQQEEEMESRAYVGMLVGEVDGSAGQ